MTINYKIIPECLWGGIKYIPNTFLLAGIPLVIGVILGTIIALIRVYKVPVLDKLFAVLITVYQGVPIVVALLIYNLLFLYCFDDLMAFLHLPFTVRDVNSIWIGIFALSLAEISYITEIIRGALLSVDPGQMEAGFAVGLTKVQAIRRIILPQMVPAAIPSLTNTVIGALKSTTLVLAFGGLDIMAGASIPAKRAYASLEGYFAAAMIYWILAVVLEIVLRKVESNTGKYREAG